jgi:hypothetical protein
MILLEKEVRPDVLGRPAAVRSFSSLCSQSQRDVFSLHTFDGIHDDIIALYLFPIHTPCVVSPYYNI